MKNIRCVIWGHWRYYYRDIDMTICYRCKKNLKASSSQWRYIRDLKYGGWAVQKFHKFLWWTWWTSEYLAGDEEEAKRLVDIKQ